ncbi:MAG: 2-amino-4-hydroxy-6-hydroxymethyldihydropteridine diphosphokinase [Alphaproteobacteria bacterium]
MILIGIGANLAGRFGSPRATCEAALTALAGAGTEVEIVARSRWWRTAPVPASDQPWFINGVAAIATPLDPDALLALLHDIERDLGRVRSIPNAARVIDLDLLAYHDIVRDGPAQIPHPRLHERAFVLFPLMDITTDWRHPTLGVPVSELVARLSPTQVAEPDP